MPEYKFVDQHIELANPPAKPKKLTATRFASVLGLNAWNTPFQIWAQVTRTWDKPFEETIYTHAGKIIEPKIDAYLRDKMFLDVTTPEQVYGENFFKKTWGDFFQDKPILGGMWDALGYDDEKDEQFVIEIKSTKRAEDWKDGAPEYYKLQAALYTYLLGLDRFILPVTFLEASDYDHPEDYEIGPDNFKICEYSLAEEYPNFEAEYVKPALKWWHDHVETGISPDFDERADAEPLKALRTAVIDTSNDDDITKLLRKADRLQGKINTAKSKIAPDEDELKAVKKQLTDLMKSNMADSDDHAEIESRRFAFVLGKSVRTSVDSKKLKDDGIFEDYSKTSTVYTLRVNEKESK